MMHRQLREAAARASAHRPAFLSRRHFGYRLRLWKPAFASDLPPALRLNAEVARYVAPDTTPHKKTWTIRATARLYEIAPELCAGRRVHELAANIVYQALTAVDCKCRKEAARRTTIFRSDLFAACSNLFEVHHVHDGAECIFGVLNAVTLAEVSPTMRTTRQQRLRQLVLDTVEEWVAVNQESFTCVNARGLFEVVGPRTFFKLIPRLHLNVHALSGEDIEVLYYHLVEEAKDLFGTLRISLSLLPVEDLNSALGGSSWTLRRVLALIESRRSEEALRFFLHGLSPASLLREALRALRERDFETGYFRNSWSYIASLCVEADVLNDHARLPPPEIFPAIPPSPPRPSRAAIDEDFEVPKKQQIFLTDGELRPFSLSPHFAVPLAELVPASALRDAPWPQLVFDPEHAQRSDCGGGDIPPSSAADAYSVLSTHASGVDELSLWGGADVANGRERSLVGANNLPQPGAGLPLDAIHFVDNVQVLSNVLTFLQQLPPAFVGVDLEWTDPQPVSIIQIATPTRAFVIDVVAKTPLYMSVLHLLVGWLLKNASICKLFFGFPNDLLRLNQLIQPLDKQFTIDDNIVSVIDLYMHRVRRVQVSAPKVEDTPLGREGLLSEALLEGDFGEIQRLGQHVPVHPPQGELAERVFIMGLHSSLSGLAERHLGFSMDKSLRRSNWNFRPLSAAQVVYAAVDAHVLLRLEAALRAQGALPQRILGASPQGPSRRTWYRPGVEKSDEFL